LDPRGIAGIFLSISETGHYRVYNPETNKVLIVREVKFKGNGFNTSTDEDNEENIAQQPQQTTTSTNENTTPNPTNAEIIDDLLNNSNSNNKTNNEHYQPLNDLINEIELDTLTTPPTTATAKTNEPTKESGPSSSRRIAENER
jgi:hypothetical protein